MTEASLRNEEATEALAEQAVLEKRARELARKPASETDIGARIDIVEFTMAHERYGIESRFVREVHPLRDLTPLPGTPAFVLGIVNLRSRVISLVDLKKFFSLPEKGLTDTNHVLLLTSPEMEFGILADTVLGVRDLPVDELQGDLPNFAGQRKDYLLGVARDGTIVLNAGHILSDPKIVVRDAGGD